MHKPLAGNRGLCSHLCPQLPAERLLPLPAITAHSAWVTGAAQKPSPWSTGLSGPTPTPRQHHTSPFCLGPAVLRVFPQPSCPGPLGPGDGMYSDLYPPLQPSLLTRPPNPNPNPNQFIISPPIPQMGDCWPQAPEQLHASRHVRAPRPSSVIARPATGPHPGRPTLATVPVTVEGGGEGPARKTPAEERPPAAASASAPGPGPGPVAAVIVIVT